MGPIASWLMSMPQERNVEAARDNTTDLGQQRDLAVEARRDFTRDLVANHGVGEAALGLTMPVVAAAEQVGKAAMATPVIGPFAEKALRAFGLYNGSRAGFSAEHALPTVGATFTGALQGLQDRGMFR